MLGIDAELLIDAKKYAITHKDAIAPKDTDVIVTVLLRSDAELPIDAKKAAMTAKFILPGGQTLSQGERGGPCPSSAKREANYTTPMRGRGFSRCSKRRMESRNKKKPLPCHL